MSIKPPEIRTRVSINLARPGVGPAEFVSFTGLNDSEHHVALSFKGHDEERAPLVRVHSECLTGDVFSSTRCDCGPQLDEALKRISLEGGVLLYLRQEGRGIGLYNKLDAYVLQNDGADTFQANKALGRKADERDYSIAVQMLKALGIQHLRLLTNNPDKVSQLISGGLNITEVVPTETHITVDNQNYLESKATKAGHTLNFKPITWSKR